ncbi:glycosyl hydrolase family 18 protein [Kutzneria sp. NPDC052558]|uniref:glycosyl hydrolase family 18 protein n=1 Tax=Kutzneria sp. NPDC052558 TaxID=3364121 RepID=UPI0037C52B51
MRLRTALLSAAVLAASVSGLVATAAAATAPKAATPLPTHVFAPYFETYQEGQSPSALAKQAGVKYLTLAFLQTAQQGSCTLLWDGATAIGGGSFGAEIAALQAAGGDAIPSLGGYAADTTNTELADSCTDVSKIAAGFESLITTYNISRIDLDVEADSLNNSAGIDRRNKAIKLTEDWAAANGRGIQFSYTLPTTPTGLATGLAVLQNAVSNQARVDVINLMTFDYYDNAQHNMATDTQTAVAGLINQITPLYPGKTQAQLYAMVGVTEMPGRDDYGSSGETGPPEIFTVANATTVYNWAVSKGINTLSFWALQRDNGGCNGTPGNDSCSGIQQNTWDFSHVFAPFTSGSTPPPANDFSVAVNPGSAAVNPGGSTSATVQTAVTAGSAQNVALSVSGAPSGVTASVSPTSVSAGGTATLSVSTTSGAAPGSYPLTVTGTAGSTSHSSTFTLTVNGTAPPGAIVNPGLETGALSPWTCQSGGAVVGTPVHGGAHALSVAATSSQTGECDQTITVSANASHRLTVWVRGNFAYAGVKGGASAETWTSSSGYTQLTIPFTTGASGAVTVYVHGWYAQGTVYADDFAVS